MSPRNVDLLVYHGELLYRERIDDPSSLEEVLVRHPKMKLIIMHAGWPFLDDTVALLAAYPQVYIDLGAVDWAVPRPRFDHYLEQLMIYGFGKRVLFGSDQMVWPEATAQAIARFRTTVPQCGPATSSSTMPSACSAGPISQVAAARRQPSARAKARERLSDTEKNRATSQRPILGLQWLRAHGPGKESSWYARSFQSRL